MAEQRLIDANLLLKEAEESLCENPHTGVMAKAMHTHEHRHFMCMILHQTIIDPETLPIVQQLRAELARVTAERDAAVADMQALMWYSGDGCEICEHKIVEQRHPYTRLGCKLNGECNPKWCGVEDKND